VRGVFGDPRIGGGGGKSFHFGVDVSALDGTAVYAVRGGRVSIDEENITVIEVDGELLVVDCGLAFPDPEMLGIDLVIPDVTYLEERRDRVRDGQGARTGLGRGKGFGEELSDVDRLDRAAAP